MAWPSAGGCPSLASRKDGPMKAKLGSTGVATACLAVAFLFAYGPHWP